MLATAVFGQTYDDAQKLADDGRWEAANAIWQGLAEEDDTRSMDALAYNYTHGRGFDVDYEKAFALYVHSAELGSL